MSALPDTEEVTGSNPVRPTLVTRHFLFLALPGSALWPYNWPYGEGGDMPRPQAHGHRRGSARAHTWPHRHARERFMEEVALNRFQHDSDDVPGAVVRPDAMARLTPRPRGN